nr:PREDICTED: transcription initiation factor TFIID subunit 9B [Struthio camelus australis]
MDPVPSLDICCRAANEAVLNTHALLCFSPYPAKTAHSYQSFLLQGSSEGSALHDQAVGLAGLKDAPFSKGYVTTILEDAKIYSSHAKKSSVDADDVRLAIQCRTDQSFTSPPPRDFLLDIARQKNQTPLPLIKPYSGPRLPPDRYCLTAPNYRLKSLQKKVSSSAGRITVPRLSVGAVSSRPSTPTLGTPSAQTVSVSTKVGTPVSLTGQRFTVQIPSSQATVKSATPTTPTVQNVLINPSLIGPKNILITTNMVSSQNTASESNPLKRKHEDDDDYDNL